MKTKNIFKQGIQWSLYAYDQHIASICCILFFCGIILINPHYETVEAKEINEQLFINSVTKHSNKPAHWLFRKKPTKEQSSYFVSFHYNKKKGLSSIAKEYGISANQILALNAISSESAIPEDMLLYASSIPGRIVINNTIDETLLDLISSLKIEKVDSIMRYNDSKEYDLNPLLYGAPIFIPQSVLDDLRIDKETIHQTDSDIYQLTLADYEEQVNKVSSQRIHNTAPTTTSIPSKKPEKLHILTKSILKAWRPNIRENNGMIPGHCTYYAAYRAKFLFPEVKPGTRRKIIKGNANERLASAKKNGFKTASTPSVGAVIVFKNGGTQFFSAGHVAIVESVNREEKSIIVSDMNYAGLGIVTERVITMNDTMTEATSSSQNVIGFIPVQELPEGLKQ